MCNNRVQKLMDFAVMTYNDVAADLAGSGVDFRWVNRMAEMPLKAVLVEGDRAFRYFTRWILDDNPLYSKASDFFEVLQCVLDAVQDAMDEGWLYVDECKSDDEMFAEQLASESARLDEQAEADGQERRADFVEAFNADFYEELDDDDDFFDGVFDAELAAWGASL